MAPGAEDLFSRTVVKGKGWVRLLPKSTLKTPSVKAHRGVVGEKSPLHLTGCVFRHNGSGTTLKNGASGERW